MSKYTFSTDANERLANETSKSHVSNTSNSSVKEKKGKEKNRRSNFYLAREKTIALFEKACWLADELNLGEGDHRTTIFKKCLSKALNEMERYNEEAFKKDLSMRMARLINDKRFDRACKRAQQSLFNQAQLLSWCSESVFQQILADGIDHVVGFNTPNVVAYNLDELKSHLLFHDVVSSDLDGDPYRPGWEERQKDAKAEEEKSDAA